MAAKTSIIERVEQELDNYPASFRQIAQIVLAQPVDVVRMSIARLAQMANVSDPSIMRFCHNLGYEGFKDFKLALAEELTIKTNYLHLGMQSGNGDSYIHKVAVSSLSTLSEMASVLDEAAVESAVEVLGQAKHLEFWGQGASAIVAMDAYHKFFRVGIPCATTSDPHMQSMAAGVMGPGDVLVVISHTGRTKELIQGARLARANGASVVGITMEHSPLADECTHLVAVNLDEDTDVLLPMVSRLAHLLAIDILAVGVMVRRGPAAEERVRRTKESLAAIKYTNLDGDDS